MHNIPGLIIEVYVFGAMLYMCASTFKLRCKYDEIADQTLRNMSACYADSDISATLGNAMQERYNITRITLARGVFNLALAILIPVIATLLYTITFGRYLLNMPDNTALYAFTPSIPALFALCVAISLGCFIYQVQHLYRAKMLLPCVTTANP